MILIIGCKLTIPDQKFIISLYKINAPDALSGQMFLLILEFENNFSPNILESVFPQLKSGILEQHWAVILINHQILYKRGYI